MKIPKTLEKLPDEVRVFAFDFSRQPEITEGLQTLVSGIITSDPVTTPLLVISSAVVDGALIKATFSGGLAGQVYQINCDAPTSGGALLEMYGNLLVVDPDTLEATA